MYSQDALPLAIIALLTAVVFLYVFKLRNPKLTVMTVGPLFFFLVAGVLGIGQLYVMGAMILSVCAVCYVFSARSLRHLSITRSAGSPVTRGDPVEIRLEIANRDWAPKLFLRARCRLPEWLKTEDDTAVFPGLWPGQKAAWQVRALAAKRGCYALPPLEVVGADPLDVFQRLERHPAPVEVVVHPTVDDAPWLDLWGDDLYGAVPARRAQRRSHGLDFHSLRDYQPGDDPRTIDWKATARLSRLIVVEFEPTQVGDLVVLLDNRASAQVGEDEHSTLERAISIAAGALLGVMEARGMVRLRYLQKEGIGDFTARSGERPERVLDALARIQAADGDLGELVPFDLRGRAVLFITPAGGPDADEVVRRATAAGGRPAAIVLDAATFDGARRGEGIPADATAGRLRGIGARVLVVGRHGAPRERTVVNRG